MGKKKENLGKKIASPWELTTLHPTGLTVGRIQFCGFAKRNWLSEPCIWYYEHLKGISITTIINTPILYSKQFHILSIRRSATIVSILVQNSYILWNVYNTNIVCVLFLCISMNIDFCWWAANQSLPMQDFKLNNQIKSLTFSPTCPPPTLVGRLSILNGWPSPWWAGLVGWPPFKKIGNGNISTNRLSIRWWFKIYKYCPFGPTNLISIWSLICFSSKSSTKM